MPTSIRFEHGTSPSPEQVLNPSLDARWMSVLRGSAIHDDEFEWANQLLDAGTPNLNFTADESVHAEVLRARVTFFEDFLGFGAKDHPLHGAYATYRRDKPTMIPLDTFVGSQRQLATHGIDPAQVLKTCPGTFGLSSGKIEAAIELLEASGFDAVAIIGADASVLSPSPESIKKRLQLFDELHIRDASKIAMMFRAPEKLQRANLALLQELGLPADRIVRKMPTILNQSTDKLRLRYIGLAEDGFNASKLVSAMPPLLCMDPVSFKQKQDELRELGLDPIRIFNTVPAISGLATSNIRAKLANLDAHGLVATDVAQRMPGILTVSEALVIRRLRLVRRLLTALGSRQDAAELAGFHPIILASADAKLIAIARFVAEHATDQAEFDDKNQIRRLTMYPVSTFAMATQSGEPLTLNTLERHRRIPSGTRRELALKVIDDEEKRHHIGEKCVRAYLRYASS